jgi:HTH-type transcriptional regulator/antitoxin HigA
METKTTFHSNLAIPPGEYLEEVIGELGITKEELAWRMNRPATKLSLIFNGKKAITPTTALQLEMVLGVPAHIWTDLESEYRLTLERNHQKLEENDLKSQTSLISKFCYKDLVKMGFVKMRTKPIEKILELQRFFGVTSLNLVLESRRYQAAFRCGKSTNSSPSPEAVAAFLRIGEKTAQRMTCAPFNKAQLLKALDDIRSMSHQQPKDFQEPMREKLANTGVSVVLCPHLPRTKAHGATFWLSRDKAVLLITIRGSWADIFWFSLFHELGHILLHERQAVILENDSIAPEMIKREKEADRFAADHLIPLRDYKEFIAKGNFYPDAIRAFAQRICIDAGIVVGRLQNDGHLKKEWHNDLRTRYVWGND